MSVKEMTWAYRLQGTRIDENIKIYWFVHIIKLFISDISFFIFKFFLNSRSPIFLIVFDVHFWIASFCWGISCYLLITALLSNVLQKYHFKMFSLNFFLCFFLLFCSWKWIRIWVYQVFTQFNKKCFTQILKIFHLVNN